MKKFTKYLLSSLLIIAVLTTTVGCYMISGQKMDRLKGTYKLTTYTYTSKYERKDGYSPTPINYIEDEAYQYEDYLVITGSGTGYYIHKDAKTPAYSKEVTLSYEYDPEDASKLQYVVFNDALTVNENSGINRLGITKNGLNYTKNAFDYTELFTKREMRSEGITVRWERVDKATDLSYVQKQLGAIKKYDYQAFGARGIYELCNPIDIATGNVLDNDYQYCYYVMDTADGSNKVTVYYALKDAPKVMKTLTPTISHEADDWSSVSIDGILWRIDPQWKNYYYYEIDGLKHTIRCVSNDISDEALQSLIESRTPMD